MLFISPPFGNYVVLPNSISIKGSYTLNPRSGLIMQILKTLRFSQVYDGWVNKIGLRNKGIDFAIENYKKSEIISIAILDEKEIDPLTKKIPKDMNLELNVSCPNLDKKLINNNLKKFLNPERNWCIVKLAPNEKIETIDDYYKDGFRQFHCCNTYKLESGKGGLSGPYLIPYVNSLILKIKDKYPDTTIIAGGGVRNIKTSDNYLRNGADHISVSTLCFNPLLFGIFYYKWNKLN